MIYLVQHGLARSKNLDPEQSLTEEGIHITEVITEDLNVRMISPHSIKYSTKKRSSQTAHILADQLNPIKGLEELSNILPNDDVTELGRTLKANEEIMIVGHLPYLEKLCSWLIIGDVSKKIIQFQNSGVVALDQSDSSSDWFIKWTIFPNI